MQMHAIAADEPLTDINQLTELGNEIVALLRQREELNEKIRAKYQEAADLGAPKEGFRLAVRVSRMTEEKRADLQRGYKAGAEALQLELAW